MSRSVFEQIFFVGPPTIFGRRLHPFSIGHAFVLQSVNSPFVGLDDVQCMGDAVSFVIICSQTWQENRAMLTGGIPQKEINRIVKKYGKCDFKPVYETIRKYIEAYMKRTEHHSYDDIKKNAPVCPWETHVVRLLCSVYHCTLDEAWNMPVSEAMAYMDVNSETMGDKSMLSDFEMLQDEYMEKAGKLAAEGKTEEANKVYAELQELCNKHRGKQ